MPLLGGTAVQFLACVALLAVIVLLRGGGEIHWNAQFTLALGWVVLVAFLARFEVLGGAWARWDHLTPIGTVVGG